jgi:ribosomal protein L16 Arg81 hydroxylase
MSRPKFEFDQIIAPLGRERFLDEYWTKKFLHLPGSSGRFTPILPWAELNHILEWHPPPQPQLRIFQEGVMRDLRRYIDGPVGALRFNAGGLITLLAQGASMILDSVQEVAPAVADLADSLQEALSCVCSANLYAGWRSQRAFDVHWDAHEVIVLQLSGRKRWQVFAPTRPDPLGDDIEKAPPPTAPPIWEGILNDGDLLYLPRGFWHVAYPLDEPSLHLSWAAQPHTGTEFLYWWMRTLRRHAQARASLTNMDDVATRKKFVAEMTRRPRPRIRLPMGPVEQQKKLDSPATRVRLALHDSLFIEQDPSEPMAKFFAGSTWWFIRPEFIPAFARLSGRQSVAIEDLAALIADKQLTDMLVAALDAMAAAGLLFKEEIAG